MEELLQMEDEWIEQQSNTVATQQEAEEEEEDEDNGRYWPSHSLSLDVLRRLAPKVLHPPLVVLACLAGAELLVPTSVQWQLSAVAFSEPGGSMAGRRFERLRRASRRASRSSRSVEIEILSPSGQAECGTARNGNFFLSAVICLCDGQLTKKL